jgi:hypothetical protein
VRVLDLDLVLSVLSLTVRFKTKQAHRSVFHATEEEIKGYKTLTTKYRLRKQRTIAPCLLLQQHVTLLQNFWAYLAEIAPLRKTLAMILLNLA